MRRSFSAESQSDALDAAANAAAAPSSSSGDLAVTDDQSYWGRQRAKAIRLEERARKRGRPVASPDAPPVLFVPGVGGSKILYRDKRTGRIGHVWPSIGFGADARFEKILWGGHDSVTGAFKSFNEDRFDVFVPMHYHGLYASTKLFPAVPKTTGYFQPLIDAFMEAGFVPGRHLFGAPYDWRQTLVDRNLSEYLHSRIVHAYEVAGRRRVLLIAHSMGCSVVEHYLTTHPEAFKYIRGFVPIGASWHGASAAIIQGHLHGYSLALPQFLLPAHAVRQVESQTGNGCTLLPSPSLAWPRPAKVITPNGIYSLGVADPTGAHAGIRAAIPTVHEKEIVGHKWMRQRGLISEDGVPGFDPHVVAIDPPLKRPGLLRRIICGSDMDTVTRYQPGKRDRRRRRHELTREARIAAKSEKQRAKRRKATTPSIALASAASAGPAPHCASTSATGTVSTSGLAQFDTAVAIRHPAARGRSSEPVFFTDEGPIGELTLEALATGRTLLVDLPPVVATPALGLRVLRLLRRGERISIDQRRIDDVSAALTLAADVPTGLPDAPPNAESRSRSLSAAVVHSDQVGLSLAPALGTSAGGHRPRASSSVLALPAHGAHPVRTAGPPGHRVFFDSAQEERHLVEVLSRVPVQRTISAHLYAFPIPQWRRAAEFHRLQATGELRRRWLEEAVPARCFFWNIYGAGVLTKHDIVYDDVSIEQAVDGGACEVPHARPRYTYMVGDGTIHEIAAMSHPLRGLEQGSVCICGVQHMQLLYDAKTIATCLQAHRLATLEEQKLRLLREGVPEADIPATLGDAVIAAYAPGGARSSVAHRVRNTPSAAAAPRATGPIL
jgi:pimeloyl-ACP methyl ester carboxylesterase